MDYKTTSVCASPVSNKTRHLRNNHTTRSLERVTIMSVSKQHWLLQRVRSLPARAIIPAAAGCIVLFGSFLPWLVDPLAGSFSAWKLPADIGWQFLINIFSYGFLFLCFAGLGRFTAFVHR